MRHWLYQLLLWLTFPLWLYYSYRRCRQSDQVMACWQALWGLSLPNLPVGGVWVHAVSLGEAQVALHLLLRLRQQYPQLPLFFTAGNASALAVVRQSSAFSRLPEVSAQYLPLDYAWIRRRILRVLQPSLLMLIETELWPNLLLTAHRHAVPVVMIQARVSRRSQENYPRYAQPLLRQLLAPVKALAAQTETDRQFFIAMGANPQTSVCLGNVKYDLPLPMARFAPLLPQMSACLQGRWVWCAGSTHQQEEIPVLLAHQQLKQKVPSALLILAPRHLRHLDEVYAYLGQEGIAWLSWSALLSCQTLPDETSVIVVDQLGVLVFAYQLAQACFVGGSLVPWGGHNMLEPAALSKPIVAGPHNHNFAEIAQALTQASGLTIASDDRALAQTLFTWFTQPETAQAVGKAAFDVFLAQKGATERVMSLVSPWVLPQWHTSAHTAP